MQQFAHAFIHGFRHDHLQLDVLIPRCPGRRTDGTPFSRRRSFWPLFVPGGTRRSDRPSIVGTSIFAPSGRFRYGNGHNGVKVFATPVKKGMRQDFSDDVQIARGAPDVSGVSTAGNAHARSGLHPCRNSNFDGVGTAQRGLRHRMSGRYFETRPVPPQRVQVKFEAHLPAGLRYLPVTAAGGAGLGLAGRSRAMAGGAHIKARDRELLHRAVYGLPKGDLDLILQA